MYSQSFVSIPRETVINQCNLVIDNIVASNAETKVSYVRRCMERWNNGWWHKFRKKPDYTMETAEERIKAEREADASEWRGRHDWTTDYEPSYGHKWMYIAKEIKQIAEDSEGDVQITAQDWAVLTGSWSK